MKEYTIETILVPTDISASANQALEIAIQIAKRVKSKLLIIHVVETKSFIAPVDMLSAGIVDEKSIRESNADLRKLVAGISKKHGIKADYKSYRGNVYDNILRTVHIADADLIVMGTHGTSETKKWFFGRNAFNVLSNTTAPVLTINRQSDLNSNETPRSPACGGTGYPVICFFIFRRNLSAGRQGGGELTPSATRPPNPPTAEEAD